jgi:putative transposase
VGYGDQRIHVLLCREGWLVNSKRICRVYREMGLQLRNKSPKRPVKAQLREDRAGYRSQPGLGDGLRPRPAVRGPQDPHPDPPRHIHPAVAGIEVRLQFRGADVVATLDRVGRESGYPKAIRLDNGPEFITREPDLWAFIGGVMLDFNRPGKPTDNAFTESQNGKFRAECLNANWFVSLDQACRKCEAWLRYHNEVRPHSAIGNQVPATLHRSAGSPGRAATR